MKKYEIMFIVRSNIEETSIKNTAKEFEDILVKNNTKIIDKKEFGQKALAFELNKHKSGYYFLYQVEADDSKGIEEFNRRALISEDIIRHLITRIEE